HEADAPLREIAQAAVKQARRAAAAAEGEVALVNEEGSQTAHGRIARDARADDPAADDEDVKDFVRCTGHRLVNISRNSPTFSTIKSGGGLTDSACWRVLSPLSTSTPTAPAARAIAMSV